MQYLLPGVAIACGALLAIVALLLIRACDLLVDLRRQAAGIWKEVEKLRATAAEIRGHLPD